MRPLMTVRFSGMPSGDFHRLMSSKYGYITIHSLHHLKCNCNYTILITPHHNYNSTTLQLQLQLHYTTLHPAVVGEVTDQVTTATIAATPKNTAPTTFRFISGFALPSVFFQQPNSPIGLLFLKLPPPPWCGTTGI